MHTGPHTFPLTAAHRRSPPLAIPIQVVPPAKRPVVRVRNPAHSRPAGAAAASKAAQTCCSNLLLEPDVQDYI